MRDRFEHPVYFEVEGGEFQFTALFDVDAETYPAEPYSWGASRGDETEASARFVKVQFGGLELGHNLATMAFGREQIASAEQSAAEAYLEQYP